MTTGIVSAYFCASFFVSCMTNGQTSFFPPPLVVFPTITPMHRDFFDFALELLDVVSNSPACWHTNAFCTKVTSPRSTYATNDMRFRRKVAISANVWGDSFPPLVVRGEHTTMAAVCDGELILCRFVSALPSLASVVVAAEEAIGPNSPGTAFNVIHPPPLPITGDKSVNLRGSKRRICASNNSALCAVSTMRFKLSSADLDVGREALVPACGLSASGGNIIPARSSTLLVLPKTVPAPPCSPGLVPRN
mmetsp:Transcript_9800/g.21197  ORF Transcript_9800/g.21197 Transcript_9800/m.21197 type:complete len:249 (+) Transcript_9800:839-1585(+)